MLRDSYAHATTDINARNLAEAKVDAQRLLDATSAALLENGEQLLDAPEIAQIKVQLATLQSALAGTDLNAVKRASDALNQGTVEFAARRMNASVKRALTGQKLDELNL